ncbi:hypothetical protein J6590_048671 [Homalodisca vitripennis]|nr:hypothetical protein J6590_048671 [Homalodisca vitripennis]
MAVAPLVKAAKVLCGIMNLPNPTTKFLPYTEILDSASQGMCFKSMRDVVEEAVLVNERVRDIPVYVAEARSHLTEWSRDDTERLRNSLRTTAELKKARQTKRQAKRMLGDLQEDTDNP